MDSWIIRTEGISKGYKGAKRKAVDGLSLIVPKGTIYGILGPNGAGKTTTLSMLCGLLEPDEGTIELAPEIAGKRAKTRIGYVPQELALYAKLTARENLMFFGRLYSIYGVALTSRVDELLELVGLEDRADDQVFTYSTGMQRRLNLAIGLIQKPEIILLDEPTVGIDPQSRNCIFEAVEELRRKGVSILYTTHYMEEASRLCDRIAIMDEGRVILEDDPRDAVLAHGRYQLEFELDGDADDLSGEIEALDTILAVEERDQMLTVYLDDRADTMSVARSVIETAAGQGVSATLNSMREPDLESLFLDLTGKTLRDAG